MPALIATVGASTANSYATVAEADTYLDERLNTGLWTDAVTDDRERALIQATRMIDSYEFQGISVKPLPGTSAGAVQALKWPRLSATNAEGWTWAEDVVPQIVKDAAVELALWLTNQGATDPLQPTGLEGFQNVKVGALDVTPRQGYDPEQLPSHIRRLLAPVLIGGRNSVRLYRS